MVYNVFLTNAEILLICIETVKNNISCGNINVQQNMASVPTPMVSVTEKTLSGDDFPLINKLSDFLLQAKSQFQEKWNSQDIPRAELSDFERFRTVGEGAFGRVILVRYKPTNNFCVMKMLDKAAIVATKQIEHVYYEMKTLISVRFPFLVYMLFVMKDNSYLYFAQPFIVGGDLFSHLRNVGRFDEDQARFYAVQVCLALEYLHFLDIVYRDLKPENILIDGRGYLKLTDMGFCKIVERRTYTFCGTPEYIAPEIILSKAYSKAVDWWSYGVLLYEMNAGYTPFSARNPMNIYEKIVSGRYKTPYRFSNELGDLLTNILQVDLTRRYGNLKNGVDDIKTHQWFSNISWMSILNYKVKAPYIPRYTNAKDTANFQRIKEKPLKIANKDKYVKLFEKF